MTASKILFFLSLSFILGVFLSSYFDVSWVLILLILAATIIFLLIYFFRRQFLFLLISFLFLAFGFWWHQRASLAAENNFLKDFFDKNIELVGTIERGQEREKSGRYVVKVEGAKEKVLLITGLYPRFSYGEKIKISGRLREPRESESFNYKGYLAKDGIFGLFYFPHLESLKTDDGNRLMRSIFHFKEKFQGAVRKFIPPPQVGLLEALIFGEESEIPDEIKGKLNFTGTRHVTAVSGMNITILSHFVLFFILGLGFWRKRAIWLSLFLIFIFVLMVGAQASAVRAGLMGALALLAQYFGRLSEGMRVLVFIAALMIGQNPLILKDDVGFQLSFLALAGLIAWQPIFSEIFQKIPNFRFFSLRRALAATLSAQVFTFPLLIYNFGRFPLFSVLPNILIVPFLPILTLLILAFGLLLVIFEPLGFFLLFLPYLALTYILGVVDFFSHFSFLSLNSEISFPWLVLFYFLLFWLTLRVQKIFARPRFLR